MRFVKYQQINERMIADNSVSVDGNSGEVIMGGSYALRVPVGNTAERPEFPQNGQIRYNTDTNEFEAYVNNAWEINRTDRPAIITIQNLGTGDAAEQNFGPLDPIPSTSKNILVLVENVVQIAEVNYTMIQDGADYYLRFDSAVPFGKDVVVIHGFD